MRVFTWLLAPLSVSVLAGLTVPAPATAATTYLVSDVADSPQIHTIVVHSESMDHDVPVRVNLAADNSVPRPTLYLLDGLARYLVTDMDIFLSDKNVNVVSPNTSFDNYWADWQKPGPEGYVYKWETFVTKELPPIIDATFHTNGVKGIAGMSRTGTAALRIAAKNPGSYKSVGAYSTCAQTSDPAGELAVRVTTQALAGVNADDIWGPSGDPDWAANDAYLLAEGLRGSALYVSNGTGLPGKYTRLDAPGVNGSPVELANQVFAGGAIEAGTELCTLNFAKRLALLGIPATFNFKPLGNHSWGYWQDDFKASWPLLATGLGVPTPPGSAPFAS